MAVIFEANHDSSTTITDFYAGSSGDDITIAPAAALGGTTNGLNILIDDTTVDYAYTASLNSRTNQFRIRFYLDVRGLTLGGLAGIFSFRNVSTDIGFIRLNYTGGNFYLGFCAYKDGGGYSNTDPALTNDVHYVEACFTRATTISSADGRIDIAIDGVTKTPVTGIDNYDTWEKLDVMRVGFGLVHTFPASTSGNIYIDEIVVNDDGGLIGPLGGPSASVSPSLSQSPSLSISPSASFSPSASLSISPSRSISPSPSAATSFPIIISHENCDFREYSSYTGTDISVAAEANLGGTGCGLKVVIDDATADYAIKNISPASTSGVFRIRFYIDPNSIEMIANDAFWVFLGLNGAAQSLCGIELRRYSSSYWLTGFLYDDTGTIRRISDYAIDDQPHYVEFALFRATTDVSGDGYAAIWIDGTYKGSSSPTRDNYDRFASISSLDFGHVSTITKVDTVGTIYIDEIEANNTGVIIGPLGGPSGSASPSLSQSSSLSISPSVSPSAAQTLPYIIDHETGNTAQYTSFVDDSGNSGVSAPAALASTSYGAFHTFNGTTIAYGQKSITPYSTTGVFRCRFYFDPNSVTGTNYFSWRIVRPGNSVGSDIGFLKIFKRSSGAPYGVYVSVVDDSGSAHDSPDNVQITDEPHYIEFSIHRASGDGISDGWGEVTVDGSASQQITGVLNFNKFTNVAYVRFGKCLVDADWTGTFYIDEIEFNETGTMIGPLGGPSGSASPSFSPSASMSPSQSASVSRSVSSSASRSLSASRSYSPSPAIGTVFTATHEAGNLSEWYSASSNITATNGSALAGTSWGADIPTTGAGDTQHLDAQFGIYTGAIEVRFYFDINSLPMDTGDEFWLAKDSVLGANFLIVYFTKTAGGYTSHMGYYTDDLTVHVTPSHTITDEPHCLEYRYIRATSAGASDGIIQWWLDGTQLDLISTVDNYDCWTRIQAFDVGFVAGVDSPGTHGTIFADEVVINDTGDYIGPLAVESESVSPSASASVSPSISKSASVSPSISGSASVSPSISGSASVSPSISQSASVSPSISQSASVSPSISRSASVSPSISGSASVSPSISQSASVSKSISESASESVSISPSISPSTPPLTPPICWGHFDFITEQWEAFAGNWTGTGAVWVNNGFMNTERLELEAGEYMTSRVVETGTLTMEIDYNHYSVGDTVLLEYRHGNSEANCLAAAWNTYTVPFMSLGYVQIRVTSTL